MIDFISELRDNFRVADAADILLVSMAIYFGLLWLKQTASRLVFLGAMVLAAIYFIARVYDLYMTSVLFNAFLAVLLIAFVVVFQEDIRRAFERLASFPLLHSRRQLSNASTEMLVEATFALAAERRGALIAIKGREPLERHIQGGIPLGGKMSQDLLFSIFDPHSQGHDGAVLIEDHLVTSFAAHLPLSKSRKELDSQGTRHQAALGLSECSDALVITVSEERGTVTIAQNGVLHEIQSADELRDRLEHFYGESFPATSGPAWKKLLLRNYQLKAMALFLACASWAVFAYRTETIQRTFDVPIEYREVPESVKLSSTVPIQARLTLSGSERAFQFLTPGVLKVSVDLSATAEGKDVYSITEEHIQVPANLAIFRIEPRTIYIEFEREPEPAPKTEPKEDDKGG